MGSEKNTGVRGQLVLPCLIYGCLIYPHQMLPKGTKSFNLH